MLRNGQKPEINTDLHQLVHITELGNLFVRLVHKVQHQLCCSRHLWNGASLISTFVLADEVETVREAHEDAEGKANNHCQEARRITG